MKLQADFNEKLVKSKIQSTSFVSSEVQQLFEEDKIVNTEEKSFKKHFSKTQLSTEKNLFFL